MEIRIGHLYPDVLNLYGDRGNVLAMKKRLLWRGIGCTVTDLPIGHGGSLADFDLFFIGGGQDFEQTLLLGDIKGGRGLSIKSAIADGIPMLAICGGYQLLGQYYETARGERCDFLGVADFFSVGGETRMIGNFAFEFEGAAVVGFENHSGKTYLGEGVQPLGRVLSGFGNNGEDGTEGLRHLNVFGTYSHGPALPKNPAFCDCILETALARKYGAATLSPLPDLAENAAHGAALARLNLKGG